MLLRECQTVYNAEPSVCKPGMAFQCVSCEPVVVIPTEIEAADAEPAEQSELDNPEPSVHLIHLLSPKLRLKVS